MINNKQLNPAVTELFIRARILKISIVFITQSYLKVLKDIRLNSTKFFFKKQIKTIEDQGKKLVVALEALKSKELKASEDK